MATHSTLATAVCLLLCFSGIFVTGQNDFYLTNQIVPDLLTAPPLQLLTVLYRGGITVDKCNNLDPRLLRDPPMFAWDATEGTKYTLMMLDLDFPSRDFPLRRTMVHMLATSIIGTDVYSSDVVFDYSPPAPMWLTGVHRYVFLVYEQSPVALSTELVDKFPVLGRMRFDLDDFVRKYNLTGPIAGNCLMAEFSGL